MHLLNGLGGVEQIGLARPRGAASDIDAGDRPRPGEHHGAAGGARGEGVVADLEAVHRGQPSVGLGGRRGRKQQSSRETARGGGYEAAHPWSLPLSAARIPDGNEVSGYRAGAGCPSGNGERASDRPGRRDPAAPLPAPLPTRR